MPSPAAPAAIVRARDALARRLSVVRLPRSRDRAPRGGPVRASRSRPLRDVRLRRGPRRRQRDAQAVARGVRALARRARAHRRRRRADADRATMRSTSWSTSRVTRTARACASSPGVRRRCSFTTSAFPARSATTASTAPSSTRSSRRRSEARVRRARAAPAGLLPGQRSPARAAAAVVARGRRVCRTRLVLACFNQTYKLTEPFVRRGSTSCASTTTPCCGSRSRTRSRGATSPRSRAERASRRQRVDLRARWSPQAAHLARLRAPTSRSTCCPTDRTRRAATRCSRACRCSRAAARRSRDAWAQACARRPSSLTSSPSRCAAYGGAAARAVRRPRAPRALPEPSRARRARLPLFDTRDVHARTSSACSKA